MSANLNVKGGYTPMGKGGTPLAKGGYTLTQVGYTLTQYLILFLRGVHPYLGGYTLTQKC